LECAFTRAVVLQILRSDRCRAILPWTETAARAFHATFRPDPRVADKVRVVYPAVRLPELRTDRETSDECRLLFVANRPEYNAVLKGGRELLAAFKVVRRTFSSASLTMVGPMPAALQAEARSTPGVVLTGSISREALDRIYRHSDVYVMPTLSDTFGMVFLEAMAYGLPVIALDRPFTRDIVQNGVTGVLVPAPCTDANWVLGDGRLKTRSEVFIQTVLQCPADEMVITSLVSAITMLVGNRALRQTLGAAGRKEVSSGRFSIARRNASLRTIYTGGSGA
jgi:glycosyltransferase involved in cell wall biosynthesis